jgi:hypothetical protein
MPAGFFIPVFTGTSRALRRMAHLLGAETVGHLWIGLSAQKPHHPLSTKVRERARRIGRKLA